MKFSTSHVLAFLQERRTQRNIRSLTKFVLILISLVIVYSVLFHFIMEREGQQHTWVTGFYWTLTVMSTLGFGDITFESDLGRVFTMIVLATGIVFLLVLLPFTIIQWLYAPWVEAITAARTPRKVDDEVSNHIILTRHDSVTVELIRRLEQIDQEYVLLIPEFDEASRLHDQGIHVVHGPLDATSTYEAARANDAAMIATTCDDVTNTNVAFLARQVAADISIASTSSSVTATTILEHAGANSVFELGRMMGRALARCMVGGDALTHVVGRVDQLYIAEANAHQTPLVGQTIRENRLGDLGVSVIGLWDRGKFRPATPETVVGDYAILLLAGSEEQLANYDEAFVIYNMSVRPVLIIGYGSVGAAAAEALTERGVDWTAVERDSDRVHSAGIQSERIVIGDATDPSVLKEAGLEDAPAVLITSHDDSLNTYLTIYCRSVRPDIQIISRATLRTNTETLHKAGADFVHSYASMGALSILNQLKGDRIASFTEGLHVFRRKVPVELDGKTLAECSVREKTGCTIIALRGEDGTLSANPPASAVLRLSDEIVLVGGDEAESRFLVCFGSGSGRTKNSAKS
jgi:voltage-gated potassium channel